MKKIVIPVVVFIIAAIASIIFFISDGYSKVQYGKDCMFHMMTLEDGGRLYAEYNGVKTQVVGHNLSKVYSVLTVSELKRIYLPPSIDKNEAVFLEFSDGAEYIIAKNSSIQDGIFILYTYKGKKLYLRIDGYDSFNWIIKAVSPSGISNENIIIDDF